MRSRVLLDFKAYLPPEHLPRQCLQFLQIAEDIEIIPSKLDTHALAVGCQVFDTNHLEPTIFQQYLFQHARHFLGRHEAGGYLRQGLVQRLELRLQLSAPGAIRRIRVHGALGESRLNLPFESLNLRAFIGQLPLKTPLLDIQLRKQEVRGNAVQHHQDCDKNNTAFAQCETVDAIRVFFEKRLKLAHRGAAFGAVAGGAESAVLAMNPTWGTAPLLLSAAPRVIWN